MAETDIESRDVEKLPPSALVGEIERTRANLARTIDEIADRVTPDMKLIERSVNGEPGLITAQDEVPVTVFSFDIVGDRIKHIWVVRNPEKLRAWRSAEAVERSRCADSRNAAPPTTRPANPAP